VADRDESRRQVAKRQRRVAGDRSARLASTLMKLTDSALAKLVLDDELRDDISRARAISSPIARRRAERTLAGELRRIDIGELEAALAAAGSASVDASRLFHLAEQWRARLLEEGATAAAEFPGGNVEPLPTLISNAQRERATGKPAGAARVLFRYVLAKLQADAS
jgi:ribosome-associated protein